MGVTDRIEAFINELIRQQSEDEEWLEIGRNELASIFGCVPSQINYVISTRFSPERGYSVQSRRGGGGCIRIRRIMSGESIRQVVDRIGDSTDEGTAQAIVRYLYENGALSKQAFDIITAAVSDASIPLQNPARGTVRAAILKNALLAAAEK
jgi:transcriptional regulator CtsR